MSEFQYHEWQTIDRLLSAREQEAVNELSSHIEVSPSRAIVTYDWSSFRHDPKQVLLKYFDAYFYFANWGSLRLIFRFPKGLLNSEEIKRYCDGDFVTFETIGEYQVLDIDFNPEDGDWMEETSADLSDFIQLRADLLEGDYRLLYLVWLLSMTFYEPEVEDEEDEDCDLEPPVPPGLKKLTPALENFIRVFDIDPFLVNAAAEASHDRKPEASNDYRGLVARLSRSECDDFLVRLADGDAGVKLSLRKRLSEFQPKETVQSAKPRTLQSLLARAKVLEQAENERLAKEAQRKHVAEMKALAQKEPQLWKQVDQLLESGQKIASVYDEATAILEKLQQLADYQGSRNLFNANIRGLADKYRSRPSLMSRWQKHGWV